MTDGQHRVGEQRPGGRATRVRSAVLDATSMLLSEVGYDQLSVEAVASRAGVHKTTVYRRWPTKPELIAEAALVQAAEAVPIPDTGTLLGDLQTLLARSSPTSVPTAAHVAPGPLSRRHAPASSPTCCTRSGLIASTLLRRSSGVPWTVGNSPPRSTPP